jgi:hypothetical protein
MRPRDGCRRSPRRRALGGRLTFAVNAAASPERPAGVTALAGFFVFGTLASELAAVSLLTPGGPLEPMWRLESARPRVVVAHGLVGADRSRRGLSCMRRRGLRVFRRQALGISPRRDDPTFELTGDFVNVALGIEPRAWVGVPIVALLIWYLSSRRVRSFFGLRSREAA